MFLHEEINHEKYHLHFILYVINVYLSVGSLGVLMNKHKVVIIGGGIAGLYTALQLDKLAIPYVLFEAKEDFGGRIFSEKQQAKSREASEQQDNYHDLGPTWIFPHHHKMQQLAKLLEQELFQQYVAGDVIYHANNNAAPQIIKNGQAYLLHRLKGGLYKLILAMQQLLPSEQLKANHQVKKLKRVDSSWEITVENTKQNTIEEYVAEHMILALPPRLVTEYLTPKYWASKHLMHEFMSVPTWMAAQAKLIVTYAKPFWREKNFSGQAFSRVGPMIEIHDASAQENDDFALFGFIGFSAKAMQSLSVKQVKELCINQLTLLFGAEAKEFTHCYLKSWGNDPFVATAKDITQPPAHPDFYKQRHQEELSQLKMYLAGSEYANDEAGYLEGAINAADQAIKALIEN